MFLNQLIVIKFILRLLALTLTAVHFSLAGEAAQTGTEVPQMIVEPSATRVSIAKAHLTVSPLTHRTKFYQGKYVLKVTPFSSKNEEGTLSLDADPETLRKMSSGKTLDFSGKAINASNGNVKIITGKMIPHSNAHGEVTFSIETRYGPMIFESQYHLVTRQ